VNTQLASMAKNLRARCVLFGRVQYVVDEALYLLSQCYGQGILDSRRKTPELEEIF
jgi:hypothetical protein